MSALVAAVLTGCGAGGPPGTTTTTTTTTATASAVVASLSLSATPTTVKSDNSTSTTVTVTALSAANAAVPGAIVSVSADTGILSTSSVTTDSTGKGIFTFSSGTASKANRTATVTATSGVSTQLPVQITGSTLTAASTGTSVTSGGTPVTMTFTAKDAGGNPVQSAAISVTASGTGAVTITPVTAPTGFTDALGQYVVSVAGGATAGAATVSAGALGVTATSTVTVVAGAGSAFSISSTTLNANPPVNNPTSATMKIGDSLLVTVAAPAPTTNVLFSTTMGAWTGAATSNVLAVPVVGGAASATLTTTVAGTANVQAVDANPANPAVSATLPVYMTAVTPASITLQAAPSVVPRSVGTTTGVATLTATVKDAAGLPVGGVPVAFSITNPTGGGETVSPVIAYTATQPTSTLGLGQASASFTSGSVSTGAKGSLIRASVPGTTVATNTTPSGADAAIVIGGTAGSVAFGQATVLGVNANASNYILAMSVMVADANGNPAPLGTVVNLSLWPIAWSTGSGCVQDVDGPTTGTFWNEDVNENLILDPGEDGARVYYTTKPWALPGVAGGAKDGLITPPNSAAGTIPGTVTTDASGVATFDLQYPKTSGVYIVDRIRARTIVQGSEAVGETQFRLGILKSDGQPCIMPASSFHF